MAALFGLDIPLWAVLGLIVLLLLYWHGTATFGTFKRMGIPYRTPLIPYFGNMLSIMSRPPSVDDEFSRKWGKIHGAFQGRLPVLEVADAEFIKQVTIKRFSSFVNRRDILDEPDNLITRNVAGLRDEHWKHVRTTISPTFTTGKLKAMFPTICECARKFVVHLRSTKSEPMVIKNYTSGYTMDVIASTAFGMDLDTQKTVRHPFVVNAGTLFGIPRVDSWYQRFKQMLSLMIILLCPKWVRHAISITMDISFLDKEATDYFHDIVKRVIQEQQENKSESTNFITMSTDKMVDMSTADAETVRVTNGRTWTTAGLTEEDIISNAITFIVAGYETTATSLQFFFYHMAKNPECQQELYDQICDLLPDGEELTYDKAQRFDYLDMCLNESMRLVPAVLRADRIAGEDVEINGVKIPKGMVVNLKIFSVQHDADYWPDPEAYNPERFSPENKGEPSQAAFLTFGAGSRQCIGMRLAMLEMRIAIIRALQEFRFECTAITPEKLDFKVGFGFAQTKEPLHIAAVPRKL